MNIDPLILKSAGERWLQQLDFPTSRTPLPNIWSGFWFKHLCNRINHLLTHRSLNLQPDPTPAEELTPDPEICSSFLTIITPYPTATKLQKHDLLFLALQQIDIEGLLLLLGQRRTSATYLSLSGFPPSYETLLDQASQPYRIQSMLSMAGRALCKHAARDQPPWWPRPTGNDAHKTQQAQQLIIRILQNQTWWNVFHHYSQGIVFEARTPKGFGARWSKDNQCFIGFLEPFDTTYCR